MKNYLFLLFAAALALGFAACSDDDEPVEVVLPEQPATPQPVIDYPDCSAMLGASQTDVIAKYGDATTELENGLLYYYDSGSFEAFLVLFNPQNATAYQLVQKRFPGTFATQDICDFFASKYFSYGSQIHAFQDDETGEARERTLYFYGNTAKQKDATVYIQVSDIDVTYVNLHNLPEQQ